MIEVLIPQAPELAARFAAAPELAKVALNAAVAKATIYLQGQARQEEPVRTGRMRNATDVQLMPEVNTGKVVVNVNYGIYVHEGTGEFAIDQSLVSGRIKHGGIHPNQFLDRAATGSTAMVSLYLTEAGDALLAAI